MHEASCVFDYINITIKNHSSEQLKWDGKKHLLLFISASLLSLNLLNLMPGIQELLDGLFIEQWFIRPSDMENPINVSTI